MILKPSENPGSYERHLRRRHNNFLFVDRQTELTQDEQMEAQQKDHDTLLVFIDEFQEVLEATVELKPNSDSDVVLKLKERLDKLYEASCIVPDDQTEVKGHIQKLLEVIMSSVRAGAGNDTKAHQELDQEETARKAHFEMLETPLIADLLNPDSPIVQEDLVPTLLSAEKEDLAPAVQLFDEKHLILIVRDGTQLLNTLETSDNDMSNAAENLVFIEGYIEYLNLPENIEYRI